MVLAWVVCLARPELSINLTNFLRARSDFVYNFSLFQTHEHALDPSFDQSSAAWLNGQKPSAIARGFCRFDRHF